MTDFAEVLDQCIADIRQGRTTLAACQTRYPQHAEQLAALLSIAAQLPELPATALPADKRQAIRAQLLQQAANRQARPQPARKPQTARPVWRRLLPVAVALLVIVSLGWGATSVSAASLPGDLLYPVKRLSEQAAIVLTSPAGQPELHLTLAQRRLDEYSGLSVRGEIQPALLAEAVAEISLVLSQDEQVAVPGLPERVEQVAGQAEGQLQILAERTASLSAEQQQTIRAAQGLVAANRARITELKSQPGGRGQPTITSQPPTATSTSTSTPLPTFTATLVPTQEPTDESTKPGVTPPGLVKTPKPDNTPPGLEKTPKPATTPPGLDKTPKPSKEPPPKKK